MKKKLKIVIAATGISSLGCDLYIDEVSRRLRQKGHRVWVIKVNPRPGKLHQDDIAVAWSEPPGWRWFFYLLAPHLHDRSVSQAVANGIKKIKEPPDIVHLELPYLGYSYPKNKEEKLVIRGWYYPPNLYPRLLTMWGVGPRRFVERLLFMIRQYWYYQSERFAFSKAEAIITLTPQLSTGLQKWAFSNWIPREVAISWIPWGTKIQIPTTRGGEKIVKIGAVAYDLENPRKGILLLLQACKQLKDSPAAIPYQLELVGKSTSWLVEQIRNAGLKNQVRLLGQLSHAQVLRSYRRWDIFVMPSLFEELGLVAIEAMAAGLSGVGWDIEGLKASWGKTGILLPKGDVKSLAKTLQKLINSPKKRCFLGQKAYHRAKKYFAWEVIVNRLERLYYALVRKSHRQQRARVAYSRKRQS